MCRYTDTFLSNINEIIEYIKGHENDFPIPLSQKVNIDEYVYKIQNNGKMVICYNANQIIALVFYYSNNIEEKKGFISLVSVDKNYRKRGIAKKMLEIVFDNMKKRGMQLCEIPTHSTNQKAINLYTSLGFKQKENYVYENGNILLIKEI